MAALQVMVSISFLSFAILLSKANASPHSPPFSQALIAALQVVVFISMLPFVILLLSLIHI